MGRRPKETMMLKAVLGDGREVKIVFKHVPPSDVNVAEPGEPEDVRRAIYHIPGTNNWGHALTQCWLLEGPRDAEKEIGFGEAFCSVDDNFVKEVGRQIALKRALVSAGMGVSVEKKEFDPLVGIYSTFEFKPTEAGGKVLQAYFNRPRGGGKPKETAALGSLARPEND